MTLQFPARRLAVFVAALALMMMLALGGCAARGGARDNGSGNASGTGQSASVEAVAQLDSDLTTFGTSIDQMSADAAIDLSAQDNEGLIP